MNYVIAKNVSLNFESAISRVTETLKEQGFGIITEIDLATTLKNKIDKTILPYKILGACNPNYAYHAITEEANIGAMLPCNVTVRVLENGQVEIAAIDPVASMMAIDNDKLTPFATEVKGLLQKAIDAV